MGRYWKPTQRLVYVAAILIVIHGVTVTIHLTHLRAVLIVTYGFLVLLVALELRRLDRYVTRPPRNAVREPRHACRPSDPVRATVLGLLLARPSRALSVA
jgi:DMSO/TMAO reductase YedYZ heme-binding membrane subunit